MTSGQKGWSLLCRRIQSMALPATTKSASLPANSTVTTSSSMAGSRSNAVGGSLLPIQRRGGRIAAMESGMRQFVKAGELLHHLNANFRQTLPEGYNIDSGRSCLRKSNLLCGEEAKKIMYRGFSGMEAFYKSIKDL